MNTWCTGNSNGNKTATNATKGLIVNGALSVGSIYSNSDKNEKLVGEEKKSDEEVQQGGTQDSKWISNEEMVKVCPDIVLKDYQLIGVNWMALLHRLKFEVRADFKAKSKKNDSVKRNVNGVLADEM